MNPEFPPDPRAELESRLTALLLGELSPEDAAALRQTLAHDPDLAALHHRLSLTLDLVRETAATTADAHAGQPAPLRLSSARREALLASFKTVPVPQLAPPAERRVSWLVPIAAAAAVVLLCGVLLLPALSRAKNKRAMMDSVGDSHEMFDRANGSSNPNLNPQLSSLVANQANLGANQVYVGSPRRGDLGRLGEPSLPSKQAAASKADLRPAAIAPANQPVTANWQTSPPGQLARNRTSFPEPTPLPTVQIYTPPTVPNNITPETFDNSGNFDTDLYVSNGQTSNSPTTSDASQPEAFLLAHADSREITQELKDVFARPESTTGIQGGNPFAIFGAGRGGRASGAGEDNARKADTLINAVSDDQNNAVIVNATPDIMPGISNLISKLDVPQEDQRQLKVLPLQHADPKDVATELGALFPNPSSPGTASAGALSDRMKKEVTVNAVGDERTQSVLVTASKDTMAEVEKMVGDLDANPTRAMQGYQYNPNFGDVTDIQGPLQDLFGTATSRSNAAPILGDVPLAGRLFQRESEQASQQPNALTQRQTQAAQNGGTALAYSTSGSGFGGGGFGGGGGGFGAGTAASAGYVPNGQIGPITMTVDPVGNSIVYSTDVNKMAAVKQAELDIREDEEKRNEIASEELKNADERRATAQAPTESTQETGEAADGRARLLSSRDLRPDTNVPVGSGLGMLRNPVSTGLPLQLDYGNGDASATPPPVSTGPALANSTLGNSALVPSGGGGGRRGARGRRGGGGGGGGGGGFGGGGGGFGGGGDTGGGGNGSPTADILLDDGLNSGTAPDPAVLARLQARRSTQAEAAAATPSTIGVSNLFGLAAQGITPFSTLAATDQATIAGQPLYLNVGNNYVAPAQINAPPAGTSDTKFASVTQTDTKGIGFNWYLGNTVLNNGAIGVQGGTAPSYTGAPTVANPSGIFPADGTIGSSNLFGLAAEGIAPFRNANDAGTIAGVNNLSGGASSFLNSGSHGSTESRPTVGARNITEPDANLDDLILHLISPTGTAVTELSPHSTTNRFIGAYGYEVPSTPIVLPPGAAANSPIGTNSFNLADNTATRGYQARRVNPVDVAARASAVNQLKEVGDAYRLWAGDNGDLVPAQQTVVINGGVITAGALQSPRNLSNLQAESTLDRDKSDVPLLGNIYKAKPATSTNAPGPSLQTRTFHVDDPAKFIAGLKGVSDAVTAGMANSSGGGMGGGGFGGGDVGVASSGAVSYPIVNVSGGGGVGGRGEVVGGGATGGSLEFVTQQANTGTNSALVRQYLSAVGINLNTNPGAFVFYNDRSGTILIRGTEGDLETASQALAELDATDAATHTENGTNKELLNVEKEWLQSTKSESLPTPNAHAAQRAVAASSSYYIPPGTDINDLPLISYDWTMPVDEVIHTYAQLVGRTPLHPSDSPSPVTNNATVSFKTESGLTHTEATQALETVLGMNGLTIVPVGEKFFKVVPEASAPAAAGDFSAAVSRTLPDSGRFTTEIVKLKSADAKKIMEALRGSTSNSNNVIYNDKTGILILRDQPEKVNKMLATIKSLDGVAPAPAASVSAPLAFSPQPSALPKPPAPKPATNSPIPQAEIQTRTNAFSTFSLNVSDVSFKLAEASLQKGALPDPATVRSEEFINAFDYRDPEPAPGTPVGFAWERAAYPFAHNRDLVRFSVKTAAEGRDTGRPLNLVLLLDKSGSMERADRVAIIREALRVLGKQLQPRDTLSVVLFARTARLWADGVSGSQAAALADALDGITPEGGTNLEEAMKLAYETALRHYLANGENRVVILTDGAANLGDVKPEDLQDKAKAERTQGIALDCFGVGWEDYNDNLLEVLSRAGGGRYGFINAPEEAATEFAGQLAGALRVAASDVKVQVEFNPDRVTSYRQIGYAKDQLTKEQFRDNTVKAAQLGVKESGNALYTVELNPQGNGPICTVHVRYRTPGTDDYYEHAWDVPYTGASPSLDQSAPAIRLAASASAFSEWLAGSPYAGEVTPGQLLGYLRGIHELYGPDHRPAELAQMLQEAKSISGQ